jgi:hypothetical protein
MQNQLYPQLLKPLLAIISVAPAVIQTKDGLTTHHVYPININI